MLIIIKSDTIDVISIGMEFVIAKLRENVLRNEQESGYTRSQSKNHNERNCLVFQQIAPGDFDVISYHNQDEMMIRTGV